MKGSGLKNSASEVGHAKSIITDLYYLTVEPCQYRHQDDI